MEHCFHRRSLFRPASLALTAWLYGNDPPDAGASWLAPDIPPHEHHTKQSVRHSGGRMGKPPCVRALAMMARLLLPTRARLPALPMYAYNPDPFGSPGSVIQISNLGHPRNSP
ncbi:hypothetical protein CSHISOI_09724 [Colletotrichum shisoi]|uniref:Uncharacterized protein n=1 Tax=Colletotrichum shisoi TaxID=2078593 RepID=A0A5Q4BGA6_9PEZI|nr:hypothetical protein CSHISOI_09724 [Colletotrichum shisoi]